MANEPRPTKRIETIARGVLIWGDRVLACMNLEHGYFYLPGGHVDPGEGTASACEREFLEETGLSVRAGGCLLVCESRFTQEGKRRHEITVVFHVEHRLSDGGEWGCEWGGDDGGAPPAVASLEGHIGFEWIDRERLSSVDLRPWMMRDWLSGRVLGGTIGGASRPDWISHAE